MRDRHISVSSAVIAGLVSLASAMGVGRFAFTPLLPLMQEQSGLTLSQGGSLAAANYLGYLVGAVACTWVVPAPDRAARGGLVGVAVLTASMGVTDAFAAWLAFRFLAGVASAFVLVGVSAWVLPLVARQGSSRSSGWVYAGVGVGMVVAGLVGLAAGLARRPPSTAWLVLAAFSATVVLAVWRPLATASAVTPAQARSRNALTRDMWRLVLCYGAFGFGYIIPATFLPSAARQLVSDPAVFGWTWPLFGLAASCSTVLASRLWTGVKPRTLWAAGQVLMAAGVLAPVVSRSVSALLVSAVCVGGTFMVVTMAGLQEARRVAGESAPVLMAAMTSAFALGQLIGPFTVNLVRIPGTGSAAPYALGAGALLIASLALWPQHDRAAPHPAVHVPKR